MLFWGTAFRATLIGTEHAPALTFTALRAAPAALVLVAAALVMGAKLPRGRIWFWAAVTGLVMIAFPLIALAESVTRAGAGNAAVLANTAPFFVLILGRLFLGERASPLAIAGLGVGFAGVVVMVSSQLGGVDESAEFAFGMALALASAGAWGVGILIMKQLMERDTSLDVVGLTASQYVIGALACVAVALVVDSPSDTDWSASALWGSIAWVAIGSSAIAQLAFYAGLRRLPANRAAVWGFLAPVVAVLVEVARGDAPEPIVLAGMVLAIAGVAIVNIAPHRAAPPTERRLAEPPVRGEPKR